MAKMPLSKTTNPQFQMTAAPLLCVNGINAEDKFRVFEVSKDQQMKNECLLSFQGF